MSGLVRPVADADLGGPQGGPRQLVKRADAAGFATVGTVGAGVWPTRQKEDDEPVLRAESSLLIRGTKGDRRFAAIWRTVEGLKSQPGAICYWWSAAQCVIIDGTRHEWTADAPTPTKVGYRDLLKILSDPELWERPWMTVGSEVSTATPAPGGAGRARSVPAKRKVRTDGVS